MVRVFSVSALIFGLFLAIASVSGASARGQRIVVPQGWPKQLLIPRIGVNASVESLPFNTPADLHAPMRWGDVAWYDRGPKPGEHGRAQIYGHVDSTCCPAVFYYLRDLRKGDIVEVRYRNGRIIRFRVVWQAIYWDNQLPLRWMYQNTSERGLLLLTCTGVFHYNGLGYDHKLVVYARAIT